MYTITCNLLVLVVQALTLSNQAAQVAVYNGALGVRANVVAFICGNESYVRKANFRMVTLPVDFKNNVGICPLALVLDEVKVVVRNVPDYLLARNKFGNLNRAAVLIS